MSGNTHHLRGRLRLRFSNLKNNLPQLSRVIEALRDVAGVDAVEASPFTGGMLIHYDPAAGDTPRFWDEIEAVLAAHGLYHDPRPLKRQLGSSTSGAGRQSGGMVDGLVDKFIDKLAERSALALVAALL